MNPFNESYGLDYQAALERLDGDVVLLREIALLTLAECRHIMDQLRLAVLSENVEAVQLASLSMKSTVSCVGAVEAFEWATQLEQSAREGNFVGIALSFYHLEKAIDEFGPALIALTKQE